MQISSRKTWRTKVFNASGERIGNLKKIIVDPNNGFILAFKLNKKNNCFISPRDVISWGNETIYLGQNYDLYEKSDLVRLDRVLKKFSEDLIGKKVETESGSFIGNVTECFFDTKQLILSGLRAQKNILGILHYFSHIIRRDQIIEIRPRIIIVTDSLIRLPAPQNTRSKFGLHKSPTLDQALSVPEERTFF